LYLISADGTRKFQFGIRTPYDGFPHWSYDGTQLFWSRMNKIRVIDATTGKSKLLTDVEWLPEGRFYLWSLDYSPNGSRIAFTSFTDLYITSSEFSQPQVYKTENENECFSPVKWSSLNDRLVVVVREDCSRSERLGDKVYLWSQASGLELFPTEKVISAQGTTPTGFQLCGFSPDGKNLLLWVWGKIYFVDWMTKQIAGIVETSGRCDFNPDQLWLDQESYDSLKKLFEKFPLNVNTEGYKWEFDTKGDAEGWQVQNQLDPLKVNNGFLITKSTGDDPFMVSPMIVADADVLTHIEIRMKASIESWADFYFSTSADRVIGENKKKSFHIEGDGQFHTYTLDMRSEGKWEGIVFQLRLDPLINPGNIEIDYIRLINPLSQTVEIKSEGQQFEVDPNIIWQDTGIILKESDSVRISYVSGKWRSASWYPWVGGFIVEGECGDCILPTAPEDSLIAKVGDGEPFRVTSDLVLTGLNGTLYLSSNDCPTNECFSDNEGSIVVEIVITPQN
jgi:hypothetical protein